MPFNLTPEELWAVVLRSLKFCARLPLAGLAISVTVFLAFVLFMILFRATQWMWVHWLASPWN
jgi:hypothetical protein